MSETAHLGLTGWFGWSRLNYPGAHVHTAHNPHPLSCKIECILPIDLCINRHRYSLCSSTALPVTSWGRRPPRSLLMRLQSVNPLDCRDDYSATSDNMKLVYTGRWWVGCYIWYSGGGTGRGRSPPRPLLAVPNVTAQPFRDVNLSPTLWGSKVPPFPYSTFFTSPLLSPPFPSLTLRSRPLNPARRSGERCKLPQCGLGRSPSRQRFWCIFRVKERCWWHSRCTVSNIKKWPLFTLAR